MAGVREGGLPNLFLLSRAQLRVLVEGFGDEKVDGGPIKGAADRFKPLERVVISGRVGEGIRRAVGKWVAGCLASHQVTTSATD